MGDYLTAEARARVVIDQQLKAAGWVVQDRTQLNLYAGQGVAIREFIMAPGHGRADYLLFVDGVAVGAVEAKPAGKPLAGVEAQSAKYAAGLPPELPSLMSPLPFLYEATGEETTFTNGLDPDPRSRPVFWFHRPETMARWIRQWQANRDSGSLRARLQRLGEVPPRPPAPGPEPAEPPAPMSPAPTTPPGDDQAGQPQGHRQPNYTRNWRASGLLHTDQRRHPHTRRRP